MFKKEGPFLIVQLTLSCSLGLPLSYPLHSFLIFTANSVFCNAAFPSLINMICLGFHSPKESQWLIHLIY